MRPPIFVVMGSTGEYSDLVEWPVCWFDTEAAAQDHAVRLKNIADGIATRSSTFVCASGVHPLDPNYQRDYTGTAYYVMEVAGTEQ